MKNPNPLEKIIEERVCAHAKSLGILVYKFTSPSRRSVPDRMFINPDGKVWFVEFKRLGQKPTDAQDVEIFKLLQHKVHVFVIDNVEDGKQVVSEQLGL